MTSDPWADLHRRAAELLHAIVLWKPPPGHASWQMMCPHVAQLTRILRVTDVLREGGSLPTDPVWRTELLASATAAAHVCDQHAAGVGAEGSVKLAASRLCATVAALSPGVVPTGMTASGVARAS